MAKAGTSHDITLAVYGGTALGFTLAKDKDGNKLYEVGYAPMLGNPILSGEPTLANVPNEQAIYFQMDDWIGGLSDKLYRGNKKIYYNDSGDTRWKNKIISPPYITTITATNKHTPANNSFETFTGGEFTGWTRVNYTGVQGSTSPKSGTYYATVSQLAGGVSRLTQAIYLKGLSGTVSVWVRTSVASHARIGIDTDGSGTMTWSSYATNSGAWVELTRTFTCTGAASGEKLVLECADQAGSADFDLATITVTVSSDGIPNGFFEDGSAMYLLTQAALMKWDNTNLWWEVMRGAGTNSFTSGAIANGVIVLCHGASEDYEYSTDAGVTWAAYTTQDFNPSISLAFDKWMFAGRNTTAYGYGDLRYLTTPNSGSWTTMYCGDESWDFLGMGILGDSLYVGKENGVFKVTGTTPANVPFIPLPSDSRNCVGMYAWAKQGWLFIPTVNGLIATDGTMVESMGLGNYSQDIGKTLRYAGRHKAMAADDQWLYVFITETTYAGLFAVRKETIDAETAWRWHCIYRPSEIYNEALAYQISDVFCAWYSTLQVINGRLWFWAKDSNGTYNAHYIILTGESSPDKSSFAKYPSGLTSPPDVFMPAYDYKFVNVPKAFLSLTVKATNLTGTGAAQRYIQAYYTVDGGAITSIGTYTGDLQTKYMSNVTGKSIVLTFRLYKGASDDTSTPVVLEGFTLEALLKPTPRRIWNITVELNQKVTILSGATTNELPTTVAANLKTLLEATWPLTFIDPDGTSWTCQLLPQSYHESPYSEEPMRKRARTATFSLLEAKTS